MAAARVAARRAGRGARRTRAPAPTARGRASRSAPGGRTDRGLGARTPTPPRAPRTRSSGSPLARRGDRLASSAAVVGSPKAITMSSGLASSSSRSAPARRSAERRERPLADDHRVDELHRHVPGIGARPPASGRTPISRPPRANRSAIRWHSRASRSASAAKNRGARLRALVQQRPHRSRVASPAGGADLTPGARSPAAPRSSSQSRHSSTPSPVRALTSDPLDAGIDRVEVVEELVEVERRGAGAGRAC